MDGTPEPTEALTTIVVTPLEMTLLETVVYSDHASDGYGLAGYVYHNELDMTIFRGVISSLIQKGVIWPPTRESGNTWVAIKDEFQQECDSEVDSNGYQLINIEVKEAN